MTAVVLLNGQSQLDDGQQIFEGNAMKGEAHA